MDITDIFIECIDKWADEEIDERISYAMNNFEKWIEDLDKEELNILSETLKEFNYYSKASSLNIISDLAQKSIEEFDINNDNSVISLVRKADGKMNSSYEYWFIHRNVSGLSKNIYYDTVEDIKQEEWENIKNIVYIDDCSGTGKQFVDFLKRQNKTFAGKTIIFIVVEILEEAKKYIENYASETGIDIHVRAENISKKALKDRSGIDKDVFIGMCQKRKIINSYILGYKEAEALMAFYNNTPNDTLGIFWFPNNEKAPIFPRELDEKPGWKVCRKEKENRRKEQYESKIK